MKFAAHIMLLPLALAFVGILLLLSRLAECGNKPKPPLKL